jgi:hypothetical protein
VTALLLIAVLSATPPELNVSARDAVITASAAAAWGGLALMDPWLAPEHCRWCDRDAAGLDTLNGLDRLGTRLVWSDRHAAEVASNVVVGALPVGIFASQWALAAPEGTRLQLGQDLLVVAEAGAVQGLLNQVVKLLVARERPYAHLGLEPGPRTDDDDVSFYSGHTSTAFALVAAAGDVATVRRYPHAALVWAVGFPLAATVGYLRVAAGKHYLSDVLVGAAVGTLVGLGLPLLLHPGAVPEATAAAAHSSERPVLFTLGGAL